MNSLNDRIYIGNALDILKTLPSESIHCCVTSPPYWGLRDYGIEPQIWDGNSECQHEWGNDKILRRAAPDRNTEGKDRKGNGIFGTTTPRGSQPVKSARGPEIKSGSFCVKCSAWRGSFGLEPSYELYVKHAVDIFREVRRVLRNDGTLWLNLGDSYCSNGKGSLSDERRSQFSTKQTTPGYNYARQANRGVIPGLKSKDLIGIPWRVAFALQADGWYLRQDIIWNKTTAMPESVKDRCTKSHEYLFLFARSLRYYFDYVSIQEPASPDTHARYARGRSDRHKYADGGPGNQSIAKSFDHMLQPGVTPKSRLVAGWASGPGSHSVLEHNSSGPKDISRSKMGLKDSTKFGRGAGWRVENNPQFSSAVKDVVETRNKRSVWTISPEPFKGGHFATYPQKLVEPCILAGCPPGGIVLDPFGGTGTTGAVARNLGRHFILIEINPAYVHDFAVERTSDLFTIPEVIQ